MNHVLSVIILIMLLSFIAMGQSSSEKRFNNMSKSDKQISQTDKKNTFSFVSNEQIIIRNHIAFQKDINQIYNGYVLVPFLGDMSELFEGEPVNISSEKSESSAADNPRRLTFKDDELFFVFFQNGKLSPPREKFILMKYFLDESIILELKHDRNTNTITCYRLRNEKKRSQKKLF